jgi:capsular polysaccharide biosynthesis protein
MELKRYLEILWRRKWVIAVTVVVTMAVVVAGTLLMRPTYSASSVVRVGTVTTGSVNSFSFDIQYADRLMNTYVEMATSGPILAELAQKLGQTSLPNVKAEVIVNTELIRITVDDPNPVVATKAAQYLAEILMAHIAKPGGSDGQTTADTLSQQLIRLQAELVQVQNQYDMLLKQSPQNAGLLLAVKQTIDSDQSIYATLLRQQEDARLRDALQAASLSITEPAVTPLAPSKPNKLLNISLGLLVALAGGIGLAFLFENLDPLPAASAQSEPLPDLNAAEASPASPKQEPIALRTRQQA